MKKLKLLLATLVSCIARTAGFFKLTPVRQIAYMDGTGHTALTWNPYDPFSVEKAKAEFDRIIGIGRSLFFDDTSNKRGKEGHARTFDPQESYVAVKPIHAG